jgi:hypothetical protein
VYLPGTGESLGNGDVSLALVIRRDEASTASLATLVPKRNFMVFEIGLVSKVDVFLDADTAAEHQTIYISHLLYPCVSSCSDDIVEPVEHVAKCQPWP